MHARRCRYFRFCMKIKNARPIFPVFLLLALHCARPVCLAQNGARITLEDIWLKGTFRAAAVPGFTVGADGTSYTRQVNDTTISRFALPAGTFIGNVFQGRFPSGKNGLPVEDYAIGGGGKRVLLMADGQSIYRRSAAYRVAVYTLGEQGPMQVLDTGRVLHATLSPDGQRVAFVKGNNLYYRDLQTRKTVAVTTDGAPNRIINGNCDWVYEEEFEFTKAFAWSPDGRYLAYYRFDESAVPQFSMAKYGGLYPEQYTYKYPKAGEPNSVVSIRIYNVAARTTKIAGIQAEYFPRMQWMSTPGALCVTTLPRHQDVLQLWQVDAATGASSIFFTDRDRAYVEVNDNLHFLPNGATFVYTSERDGFNRVYVRRARPKRREEVSLNHAAGTFMANPNADTTDLALSPRGVDVEAVVSVDADSGVVYFTAAPNMVDRQLYAASLSGKSLRLVTRDSGTHAISAAGRHFLDRYSRIGQPPVYRLIDARGTVQNTIEENGQLRKTLAGFAAPEPQLLRIPLSLPLPDGSDAGYLHGYIIRPPDFRPSRRYPVLMYQYSGPGSQEVADRYPLGNLQWHQMLAQRGYIVVCVDGRGTGFRGRDFKKATYLQLGRYESDDQIAAARYLRTLPYIDSARIGIWGWSFGGFMSSTCLFKAPDVFKMAIAVAPVTNWRLYDNIYTERFMRTPAENANGYDDNAPTRLAKNLDGAFLLVHGTADDNVHFQNSVELVAELQRQGKDFDFAMYPDKAHGISGAGTRYQLYQKMTDFILENL